MKKGDKVTIRDGSWTRKIKDNKLVNGSGCDDTKQYIVIETGCSFPLYDGISFQKDKHRSDTVIQAINSGEVVFIFGNFLQLVAPTHLVWIDVVQANHRMSGRLVKISDKLYQEIINDPQS